MTKGKRTVLLTNAHPDTSNLKMQKIPLNHWFERMIYSHELGVAKKHPEFWPKLQNMENFTKDSSLLIDDSKAVLENAAKSGIGHLLAVAKPDLQAESKKLADFKSLDNFAQIL